MSDLLDKWNEHETVTLLLTDVQGSTLLWEKNPSGMQKALVQHDRLIDGVVASADGAVLKTRGEGDSVVSVFNRASDALLAALEIQRAIDSEPWPNGISIHVRMALHSGELHAREGDLYGPAINRCARLRDAAHGRQVVLSAVTAELVRDGLGSEFDLRDLGIHRLRDLARPEHVYQLLHPDLPAEFPPLRSLGLRSNNLPVQLTSFVGREKLIAKIHSLLDSSRLVTLTGPGGTGKTRLAFQVAAEVVEDFADGVWLVELAPIADPGLVPQAVASVLGLNEEPGRDLTDVILDHLQPHHGRRLLLVLDNCEHLVTDVAFFAESVLSVSRELKILATSREPLGLPGEVHLRVPPLSVPDPGNPPAVEVLRNYEAVRLFSDRAFATNPEFAIVPGNARAIAEITHRLDGLPLAIELAAARTKVLSVEQLNERLNDRFRLLTGGSRAAPQRQQTLRSLVDWSFDLLDERERTLFYRAAVFQGGFTLDAAEGVCSDGILHKDDVLETLSQLISKSLLTPDERGERTRYQMLETVREYAQEKLLQSGEAATLRSRHVDWYLALAERAEPQTEGPDQAEWLTLLDEDFENFRAALDWSECEGHAEALMRLASLLYPLWHTRGHWSEGRRWLEKALDSLPDVEQRHRAKALSTLGLLLDGQGEYGSSRELYLESLAIRRSIDDKEGIARALHSLGRLAGQLSNFEEARAYMEQSLAMRREMGDKRGISTTLGNLGLVRRMQGDFEGAIAMYEESLEIARQISNPQHVALLLNNLGVIHQVRHDLAAARTCHEESLAIKRELGDKPGIASSLNNLGWLAKGDGDLEQARRLFEESAELSRELGNKKGLAEALGNLGVLAKEAGDTDRARTNIKETLGLLSEIGDRSGLAPTLEILAAIASDKGVYPSAARLFAAAEKLREEIGVPMTQHELPEHKLEIDRMRTEMSKADLETEWEVGRQMTLQEAVELASSI